jgi:hypothetical protein
VAGARRDPALRCQAQHRRRVTSGHRHLIADLLERPGIECALDDEVVIT